MPVSLPLYNSRALPLTANARKIKSPVEENNKNIKINGHDGQGRAGYIHVAL